MLFLWKILNFSLAWGPPLCLDTEYLCFLGEKSATTLHFHGVYGETKHRPSRVMGICYTQSLWAGSAGNAGALCWQLALSAVCGSPDILQRHSCRSSSETPTSVASPSWIIVRHLTSCCQLDTAHSRPVVFLAFVFLKHHGEQRIPSLSSLFTHRTQGFLFLGLTFLTD